MRKIAVLLLMLATAAMAAPDHAVQGYYKKDGTYVAPTVATNPDTTKLNNYSTKGNVNPYTGKEGTKDPFAPEPVKPIGKK